MPLSKKHNNIKHCLYYLFYKSLTKNIIFLSLTKEKEMIETIVIAVLTCVSLICSILLFPKINIKKFEISTYWIICFIGAILMLCFGCVGFDDVVGGLFQDSAINPIKILLLFTKYSCCI